MAHISTPITDPEKSNPGRYLTREFNTFMKGKDHALRSCRIDVGADLYDAYIATVDVQTRYVETLPPPHPGTPFKTASLYKVGEGWGCAFHPPTQE